MFKAMLGAYTFIIVLGGAIHLYADKIQFTEKRERPVYCLVLKDGVPVLVSDGKPVLTEVVLDTGLKIKTDGTVIKRDGTQFVLQTGECVNDSAEVSQPAKMKNTTDHK